MFTFALTCLIFWAAWFAFAHAFNAMRTLVLPTTRKVVKHAMVENQTKGHYLRLLLDE